ncbi:MAG: excinuclease ABC subunit A, partial [Chitinivibrionales bacterium]|nr:excinuclease ABC subunit A [Chitinivibrionales bacterium]MBD3358595.1 excinuclease ABC subunit A [Chitinivibrionales bacterium]
PDCDIPVVPQSEDEIVARVMRDYRGEEIKLFAPLIVGRKGYYTDLASWAAKKGARELRVDGKMVSTERWPRLDRYKEHDIEFPLGTISVAPAREQRMRELIHAALELGEGVVQLEVKPRGRKRQAETGLFSTACVCSRCGRGFAELDPRLFSFNSKHGWCPRCFGTGLLLRGFDEEQSGEEVWWNAWWEGEERRCSACDGKRLKPEALAVRYRGRSIDQYVAMTVRRAEEYFAGLELGGPEGQIAHDVVNEIRSRLSFLTEVGLPYLTLDRAAPTLSGGEAQRIRLAAQLGSNLRGVTYILDEPTIGLHSRDNAMLLSTLHKLENKGNTVVVVEHDEETIRHAEHVIDLGPGAGKHGGRVVAKGSVKDVMRSPKSLTGQFLAHPLRHPLLGVRRTTSIDKRRAGKDGVLEVVGATLHNLKNVNVRIPLGRLVCVTGVSGSGKSTLVRDILHDNLAALTKKKRSRSGAKPSPEGCRRIDGAETLGRVLEVDQTPIGRTPRSCPATYVGLWDHVRKMFARTPEAMMRGYGPSRFSFNVKGGRCEECEGQGVKKIEMSFLPDVSVACEACGGTRFNAETKEAVYKEKNIAEVLAMSIDDAVAFFEAHPSIHHPLRLLQDVGLGYLTLGQQSPTLSGGEAQRIKLVTELAKARVGRVASGRRKKNGSARTFYVLDEPTIGLHIADVEKLVRVLHRLVEAGNTVVIIEHNLDVVAEADWIIDLGPEGGSGGGRIVAQGSPEEVAGVTTDSHTARFLRQFLAERGGVE